MEFTPHAVLAAHVNILFEKKCRRHKEGKIE